MRPARSILIARRGGDGIARDGASSPRDHVPPSHPPLISRLLQESPRRALAALALGAVLACAAPPATRAPATSAAAVGSEAGDAPSAGAGVVALVGGIIYRSPSDAPIADGALLIEGERIVAVGPRASVRIPPGATEIDVRGRTVLAGFWNSHVHFLEPQWEGIAEMPAARAAALLGDMFASRGFVHVFDIGSFPAVALPLRDRVRSGEVRGPDIRTTLAPFAPPKGTPRYVPGITLPEIADAAGARDSVRARVAQGADAVKLFIVPLTRERPLPVMALDVVRAAVDEAHRAGLPVFAHPTTLEGIRIALEGGVDILAHGATTGEALSEPLLREMRVRNIALVPTLTLWEDDYGPDTTGNGAFVRAGQAQLRSYAGAGGRILFGTDVGYIPRYDPTREYELMAGAGLDLRAILASLTTAPADAFDRGGRRGRLAPGFDADVVVIDGDPAADIRALAHVRLTMKRGRILYDARSPDAPR